MAYENQLEWIVGGKFGIYIKLFFRVLQFVLGLTIAGIYGSDLAAGAKNGAGWNANWGYAAVVGGLTAVTAAVYLVPKIKSYAFFAVDLFYVILFSAVIGIFGKAYFNRAIPIGNTGAVTVKGPNRQRMVIAAWIDVITGILWALTGISSTILWFRVRHFHKYGYDDYFWKGSAKDGCLYPSWVNKIREWRAQRSTRNMGPPLGYAF